MGDRLRRGVECSPTSGVMCVEVGCGVRGRAPRFTASDARRVHCQGGAAHLSIVRSRCSLLVASCQRAAAPQGLVARPFVPLVASVPYLSRAFNIQQQTARERSDQSANS